MIQCRQCGQTNSAESNFCRGCGLRFTTTQHQQEPLPQTQINYEYAPPRPYSWKTDEFQTNVEARKTLSDVQPTANQMPFAAPASNTLAFQNQRHLAHGYRCPHCGSNYPPINERRVSAAGWITFAVLLVTTGIFFWIGLLIREDVSICSTCKRKVN